jgi:hypothetical protein
MKKYTLLIIALCLVTGIGYAQDNRSTIGFGPKVGINMANVYDTEGEEFTADSKLGLAAGIFISIPIGTYFGIQPEVLYSQKGFKATGSVLGSNYSFDRTLNYIDVPLLIAIKPVKILTILAGPQYSYLISKKDEFNSSALSTVQQDEFENDNIRKNTFCVIGGADININRLILGARFGWDLYKNNGDGTSTTPRYKNVWYQGTIGFRL